MQVVVFFENVDTKKRIYEPTLSERYSTPFFCPLNSGSCNFLGYPQLPSSKEENKKRFDRVGPNVFHLVSIFYPEIRSVAPRIVVCVVTIPNVKICHCPVKPVIRGRKADTFVLMNMGARAVLDLVYDRHVIVFSRCKINLSPSSRQASGLDESTHLS